MQNSLAQTRKSRHLNIKRKEKKYYVNKHILFESLFLCGKRYAYSNHLVDGWVFILSYVESVRRYFIYFNNFIRINFIRTYRIIVWILCCDFSVCSVQNQKQAKRRCIFSFPWYEFRILVFGASVLSFNIPCGNILILLDKLLQTPSYACLLFFIVTLAIGGWNESKHITRSFMWTALRSTFFFFRVRGISCVVRKVSKVDYYYHKMSMKSNMHVVVVCLYMSPIRMIMASDLSSWILWTFW